MGMSEAEELREFPDECLDDGTPTDPYAMVPLGSDHQFRLASIGWVVTDEINGWAHMEPGL
jgi:hypothetical protein